MQDPFPVIHNLIHLNHAAVGPWPQQTSEVISAFAHENEQHGSMHYLRWLKVEEKLRHNLAALINAPGSETIALVKNTSEGLSFVAAGLDWQSGDNIVGIQQEFPSNRFPWMALQTQGVEYRQLDLTMVDDPESALTALCDENTRLISISAVQYAEGLRIDLAKIGAFCRQQGILFCVDAIQQLGALPFDVQAIQADFVVADGHKWMLSAEGLGLFFIRPDLIETLKLSQYGWHMTEGLGDYSQQDFQPAKSARRFECGSPNMLGIHALNTSVELLMETGLETIGRKVIENSTFLINQLQSIPAIEVLTNSALNRLSGIVTFRSQAFPAEKMLEYLSQQGVFCAARGGGIRLSPHFYTPRSQLEQTIELIRSRH